jgi:hypothetical protein
LIIPSATVIVLPGGSGDRRIHTGQGSGCSTALAETAIKPGPGPAGRPGTDAIGGVSGEWCLKTVKNSIVYFS